MATDYQSIEAVLIEMVKEFEMLDIDLSQLQSTDSLIDYGFDSMSLIKTIVMLEEMYHITFDPEILLLENFDTLEKISIQVQQAQGNIARIIG